jgi:hypothetical protein
MIPTSLWNLVCAIYPLSPLSNNFVTIIVHKHVLKLMKFGENKK